MAKINLDIQSMDIDDLIALHVEINTELFKVAAVFDFNDMLILKGKRKYIKKLLKGWTPFEINELLELADDGKNVKEMCKNISKNRSASSVRHALNRLGYYNIKRDGAYALRGATK